MFHWTGKSDAQMESELYGVLIVIGLVGVFFPELVLINTPFDRLTKNFGRNRLIFLVQLLGILVLGGGLYLLLFIGNYHKGLHVTLLLFFVGIFIALRRRILKVWKK